ncbi:maleylpyruvate isomerase family mycothiol-dependent enzyme [Streptomyces indicus]|uniref:TIGR03083 family protein n=1 Tax=Streptomyces indicus TaxID=417292 RepID=A0A1G9FEI7_9ACTN|nr:maleylpyruvate isomerase family mycothiol-dependent enzyme [Streptomyces indicus]SDK86788.1 TIGR03083 family protein [Streptomyces indicus]
MGWDHEGVRELLGAWALGAVPPAEEPRLLAHLAECEWCADEAGRLHDTVRLLDGGDPLLAYERIDRAATGEAAAEERTDRAARGRLLDSVLGQRPAAPRVAEHAAPYAAAVAGLEALLRELGDKGPWSTPVVHDWDVHATVAHLIAADESLALRLGLPARVPRAGDPGRGEPRDLSWREAWAHRTDEVIAHERTRTPARTVASWREQAAALLAAPEAHSAELAAQATTLLGVRLPIADHYVVRGFETWIHTDDIGRALGRPVPTPPDAHLWRLVRLGVRVLGLALGPQAVPVLLTVTGHGSEGEWVLGSEDEPVAAELVLDPVDFCLLLAGRYDPGEVPRGLSGDGRAARSVLERAARTAWL